MSSTRVVVTSRTLGKVEVELDPEQGFFGESKERQHIEQQLLEAVRMVRHAYGLDAPTEFDSEAADA